MSKSILILGESGRGKSTSIEGLDPKETVIIRITDKDLPFKGWRGNYVNLEFNSDKTKSRGNLITTSKASTIVEILNHISSNRLEIKNIVIDDFQYLMSFEYMNRSKEVGYNKFVEISKNAFDVVTKGSKIREDIFVFYLGHTEDITDSEGNKFTKIKTIGKMLDSAITIEGLFTIVLLANIDNEKEGLNYNFITQSNGHTTAKSPKGMFDFKIPNDLQYVKTKIVEYEN